MLYNDGTDMRLLTRLCDKEVSDVGYFEKLDLGVNQTGDRVLIIDHDVTVAATSLMTSQTYTASPMPHASAIAVLYLECCACRAAMVIWSASAV